MSNDDLARQRRRTFLADVPLTKEDYVDMLRSALASGDVLGGLDPAVHNDLREGGIYVSAATLIRAVIADERVARQTVTEIQAVIDAADQVAAELRATGTGVPA